MKTKLMLALIVSVFFLSGTAFAFHGGGVAHCDGCHSMHNSADNARSGDALAPSLMKGSDPSSTCLNCHNGSARYHVNSGIGDNTNQGGDFFWVSDGAVHDLNVRGNIVTFEPDNKGHNIIASDFGLTVDAANTVAPGGTFPSNALGCNSCHDPHGQVDGGTSAGIAAISVSGSYGAADPVDGSIHGNYRLLDENVAPAPVATANSYDGAFVNYGDGMSDWCLGCHDQFGAANMHPVDAPVPVAYNSYKASGNFTGTVDTAFDALVPFERGLTDGSDPAMVATSTRGVELGTETVMCLSCHRAHASAFDNALRWDTAHEFIADSAILNEASTTLMANGAVPYYKGGVAVDVVTEYGPWQRQLCNKCHVQD